MSPVTKREAEREMPAHPLRVLIVDDQPSARVALAKTVALLGHSPTVADDGEQALAIHARQPADVVLTDWRMPKMSGDELVRRIREVDGDERYTVVVMTTAHGDDEHRLAAMRSGADDFLVKPLDIVHLEARLLSAARVIDFDRRRIARATMLRSDSVRLGEIADTDASTVVASTAISLRCGVAHIGPRAFRRSPSSTSISSSASTIGSVTSPATTRCAASRTRCTVRCEEATASTATVARSSS
jgi:DNA-binding response OmpR family regulator